MAGIGPPFRWDIFKTMPTGQHTRPAQTRPGSPPNRRWLASSSIGIDLLPDDPRRPPLTRDPAGCTARCTKPCCAYWWALASLPGFVPIPTTVHADVPFLCFNRRASLDVLLDASKICGGAEATARGGFILQHGSLLFARSAYAPELPGIEN